MYRRTATVSQDSDRMSSPVKSRAWTPHSSSRQNQRSIRVSGFGPDEAATGPVGATGQCQLTEVPPADRRDAADRGDAGNLDCGLPLTARLLLSIMTTAPDRRLAAPNPGPCWCSPSQPRWPGIRPRAQLLRDHVTPIGTETAPP